jgi:hypothetical protein
MDQLFDLLRTVFLPSSWGIPGLSGVPDESFLVILILSVTGSLILNFFIPHRTWVNGILNFVALFAAGITANFAYDFLGFRGLSSVTVAAIVSNAGMIVCGLLIIFFSRRAT